MFSWPWSLMVVKFYRSAKNNFSWRMWTNKQGEDHQTFIWKASSHRVSSSFMSKPFRKAIKQEFCPAKFFLSKFLPSKWTIRKAKENESRQPQRHVLEYLLSIVWYQRAECYSSDLSWISTKWFTILTTLTVKDLTTIGLKLASFLGLTNWQHGLNKTLPWSPLRRMEPSWRRVNRFTKKISRILFLTFLMPLKTIDIGLWSKNYSFKSNKAIREKKKNTKIRVW